MSGRDRAGPGAHREYDELAAGWLAHTLTTAELERFAVHVRDCRECRQIIVDRRERYFAAGSPPPPVGVDDGRTPAYGVGYDPPPVPSERIRSLPLRERRGADADAPRRRRPSLLRGLLGWASGRPAARFDPGPVRGSAPVPPSRMERGAGARTSGYGRSVAGDAPSMDGRAGRRGERGYRPEDESSTFGSFAGYGREVGGGPGRRGAGGGRPRHGEASDDRGAAESGPTPRRSTAGPAEARRRRGSEPAPRDDRAGGGRAARGEAARERQARGALADVGRRRDGAGDAGGRRGSSARGGRSRPPRGPRHGTGEPLPRWVLGGALALALLVIANVGVIALWRSAENRASERAAALRERTAQERAAGDRSAGLIRLLARPDVQTTALAGSDRVTRAYVLVDAASVQVLTDGLAANDVQRSTYVLWGFADDGGSQSVGTFDVRGPQVQLLRIGSLTADSTVVSSFSISLERGRVAPASPTDVLASGLIGD